MQFFQRLRTQEGRWFAPGLIGPTIAIVLLVATALYWKSEGEQVDAKRDAAVKKATERIVDALGERIAAHELVLRGLRGYHEGSDAIDREEFHAYVEPLELERVLPCLQAVAYIADVAADQVAAHEARMQRLGFPAYQLTQKTGRDGYRPITLIEPQTADNLRVVGADTADVPEALEAQNFARDTGLATITRGLVLRQDEAQQATPSVVMYLPLYLNGMPIDSVEQRRAAIEGWVSGPFRMQDFMQSLGQLASDDVAIALFDASDVPASLLYQAAEYDDGASKEAQTARAFQVGGRTWTLVTQPSADFALRFGAGEHHLIALLGAALSLTIGWITWFLANRRDHAESLAKQMTIELRTTRDDLQATLDATPDWMFELDLRGCVLRCHNALGSPLHARAVQFLGRSLPDAASPRTGFGFRAALEAAASRGYSSGHEFELTVDGQSHWFELSAARKRATAPTEETRFIVLLRDISERKQASQRTHRLAYFDHLTGLPNRRMLLDRLAHALSAASKARRKGTLIFLDLDHFKHINDAYGHSSGDGLLVQVAERLVRLVPQTDTVAHLGGDEFVVLVGDLSAQEDEAAIFALRLAERLREAMATPFSIGGNDFSTTASVGLTLFPKQGEAVEDLLREADTAMYRAKDMGRNRICFFESAMHSDVQRWLMLEQDLKAGFARGQISAHVQPQVDFTGTVVAAELLMRWQHPQRGAISPTEFIPVAEASDLIVQLGDWMVEQACDALAQLHAADKLISLSVNVSQRQFRHDGFVGRVHASLGRTGAPADHLVFEVTESLLAEEMEQTISRMTDLAALGVRFSIDDFGTGYSNLAYLKRMPIHELKIDKSFVQDAPTDPSDTAIVQAILAVARNLGLRVVAEGVETQLQVDFLRSNRCDLFQGYFFARPEPLVGWLARRIGQAS